MATLSWDRRNVVAGVSVAVIAALWGVPLLALLAQALDASSWTLPGALLGRSIGLAGAAALAATALGALTATQLYRLPPRWRAPLLGLLVFPLLLPSYIHALGWANLISDVAWLNRSALRESNAPGWVLALWVLTMSYSPVALIATTAALHRWDSRSSWSAWANGLDVAAEARLRLQYLRAPALAAALIIFLLAFADFAVADFFQVQTYATDVFVRVSSYLDTPAALALAAPVVVISALAFIALVRVTQRLALQASYSAPLSRAEFESVAATKRRVAVALVALTGGLVVLPLANLLLRSGGIDSWRAGFAIVKADAAMTFGLAGAVAAAIVCIAFFTSHVCARRIAPAGDWVRVAPLALFALPASLLGLVYIRLWNHAGPAGWAYDAGLVLGLALVSRWLLLANELLTSGWRQVTASQEAAAMASGIPWGTAMSRVLLPQMAPVIGAAFLLTFVFVYNDLTLVTLLAPPGVSTIPLRIFQTVHYGPETLLAAVCSWQVLLLSVPAAALYAILRRSPLKWTG